MFTVRSFFILFLLTLLLCGCDSYFYSKDMDRLPVGLQELKMLIHLNLEFTKVVSCDWISNLSRLRTLKLAGSQVWLDMSLMKELQLLKHLEFGDVFNTLILRTVSLQVFVLPAMDTLRRINIWKYGGREIEVVEKTPLNKSPTSPPCFSNLSYVQIGSCDGLKDLTWLLFSPNLTYLCVVESKQLEEIISKDKAASVLKETHNDTVVPFKNLEDIVLDDLPELKSIFWSALPFERLKHFAVYTCVKLSKLPLDSKSILKVEEFDFDCEEEEWIQGIEWEDEATRNRFLPSFKRRANR
ncbi:BnaC05g09510D [Brassica napus]|uniref:(rape) hypothetical protein n=1 Tax=Brassica napus TaxID=3708 RepID=A0A078GY76_BRANA|nr:unnamed protein product [Brassica napus]CDY30069.1 BnaC05g09510D [Brassica napus]